MNVMLFGNKKAAIDPRILSLLGGAGSTAKSIGSGLFGGFGFGIGAHATNVLAQSTMGLKPLLIAIALDSFAFFTGEFNPLFGVFWHVILIWILLSKYFPGDKILRIMFWSKFFVLFYILLAGYFPTILQYFPEVHRWVFLTAGNHAFPIATLYVIFSGFISNRAGGILVQAIYIISFFALLFFAYDMAQDEVNELFEKAGIDIKATLPAEQKTVFTAFMQGLVRSTKTTGGKFLEAIRNSPQAVANFINPKVEAAGGEALWGKKKEEQPKFGIMVESHPSGAANSGGKIIVKALITIPNPLEDRSFLTVTKIRCYHLKSKSDAVVEGTVREYTQQQLQQGVNVFYNRPLSVSCEFNENDLTGVSTVKFAVGYDFESNAKLTTYVMKEDILEDLLIRNENPLDYMAAPQNKRRPTTKYDNGPARFGMGPIQLNYPPLGIKDGKTYPDFELLIGNNKAEFNGFIGKVNNIIITLPNGFSLKGAACPFKSAGGNKYSISEKAMADKPADFTNIESSRLFTCPMEVKTADALGTASFNEVEFNVDAGFTYETEADVTAKPRS